MPGDHFFDQPLSAAENALTRDPVGYYRSLSRGFEKSGGSLRHYGTYYLIEELQKIPVATLRWKNSEEVAGEFQKQIDFLRDKSDHEAILERDGMIQDLKLLKASDPNSLKTFMVHMLGYANIADDLALKIQERRARQDDYWSDLKTVPECQNAIVGYLSMAAVIAHTFPDMSAE